MDLLHEATIAQVDPTKAFQPRNVPANDPEAVARGTSRSRSHAALKKRFDAMPPEFRAMWGKVRSDHDAIGDASEARSQSAGRGAIMPGASRASRMKG